MHEMLKRLMEAIDRGMWEPPEEINDRLSEIFLENEEILEEITDRG